MATVSGISCADGTITILRKGGTIVSIDVNAINTGGRTLAECQSLVDANIPQVGGGIIVCHLISLIPLDFIVRTYREQPPVNWWLND